MTGRLYTVEEVARLFGVSPVAVRKWIRSGRLKGFKNEASVYVIPEEEVERFKDEEAGRVRVYTVDLKELGVGRKRGRSAGK
ncbi:MAG: helix-turn-helix domain-containing protein [Thermoprotei archaeon]|nr:helix-turn-helix domain-containing protein [Thermoprotei archaeon]